MPIAGWYASDKWAKANPDLVRRFAAAIKKGNDYATKNPAERNAILAKYTKIDAKMIERIVMPNFPTKLDVPGLQRQADTAFQYGALTQRLDVAPLVLDSAK
jgi:NitT/TauT family transport system substrate-binding protein